jgi:hypothetical protein
LKESGPEKDTISKVGIMGIPILFLIGIMDNKYVDVTTKN